MTVASTECSLDGVFDLARSRLPGPETDERDLVPGIEGCGFPVITLYGQQKLQSRQWQSAITHLVHSVIVAYVLAVEEKLGEN